MAAGYAGIDNPLSHMDRARMLLGDAKKMTEEVVNSMEGARLAHFSAHVPSTEGAPRLPFPSR